MGAVGTVGGAADCLTAPTELVVDFTEAKLNELQIKQCKAIV